MSLHTLKTRERTTTTPQDPSHDTHTATRASCATRRATKRSKQNSKGAEQWQQLKHPGAGTDGNRTHIERVNAVRSID